MSELEGVHKLIVRTHTHGSPRVLLEPITSNGAHIPCFKEASGAAQVPQKWYCDVCLPLAGQPAPGAGAPD